MNSMNADFKSCHNNTTNSKNSLPPRLRIADILLIDQDDDGFGQALMAGCGRERWLPQRIVARWLSRLRKISKESRERDEKSMQIRGSINGLNGGDSLNLVSVNHDSGRHSKETSFNMGIGCGLLYLIAASRNELDKMIELRTQMEMLLQNAKEELQRKDILSKLSDPNDIVAYSTTDAPEGPDSNSHLSPQTLAIPESSTIMVHDQYLKCGVPEPEESLEGMDQLEAELAAELERLQLHLDTEWNYPEQRIKNWQATVKDIAASRNRSVSSGEVLDPEEPFTEVHCGVSPYELERRLHELLEARQKERIRELENALVCANHKLLEKEKEISWWKDTAQLISKHVPEPSRRTSQHDPVTHHLLR